MLNVSYSKQFCRINSLHWVGDIREKLLMQEEQVVREEYVLQLGILFFGYAWQVLSSLKKYFGIHDLQVLDDSYSKQFLAVLGWHTRTLFSKVLILFLFDEIFKRVANFSKSELILKKDLK